MAAIDELIAQIEDPTLRERLCGEIERMGKSRRFGLVFENHLPELTARRTVPIHSATVSRGCLVGRRDRPLDDIWRVLAMEGDTARCLHRCSNEQCDLPLAELVLFKMSLSTGWDCPRAEVMMSFRRAADHTFIA